MALSSKQFRQIESAYFGIVKGKENLAEAHRNSDADLIEQYKDYVSSTRGKLAELLPPNLTDDDKQALEMVFEQLSQMTDSGEKDSAYYKQVEGYVDAILPGFADYHNQKSVNAQMRESRIAEAQTREAAYEQRRAASKISVDPKDVAEFGKFQAEHIAKWVAEQAKSGRPSNEIDEKVEEYRLKLRARANVSQDDIAEFGQAEAEHIAGFKAKNADLSNCDEAIKRYRQTLRDHRPDKNTNYTLTDRRMMEYSPINMISAIPGRTGGNKGLQDTEEFLAALIMQNDIAMALANQVIVASYEQDMFRCQKNAKSEDIERLYNELCAVYKNSEFSKNGNIIDTRIIDKLYDTAFGQAGSSTYSQCAQALLKTANPERDSTAWRLHNSYDNQPSLTPEGDRVELPYSKKKIKTECERFGGIGLLGGAKSADPAKIEEYKREAQVIYSQLTQRQLNAIYVENYFVNKELPDYRFFRDQLEREHFRENPSETWADVVQYAKKDANYMCDRAENLPQEVNAVIHLHRITTPTELLKKTREISLANLEVQDSIAKEVRKLRENERRVNKEMRQEIDRSGYTPYVEQRVSSKVIKHRSQEELEALAKRNIAIGTSGDLRR